jgi:hypothetical protein
MLSCDCVFKHALRCFAEFLTQHAQQRFVSRLLVLQNRNKRMHAKPLDVSAFHDVLATVTKRGLSAARTLNENVHASDHIEHSFYTWSENAFSVYTKQEAIVGVWKSLCKRVELDRSH